jgi:hypothetical protein
LCLLEQRTGDAEDAEEHPDLECLVHGCVTILCRTELCRKADRSMKAASEGGHLACDREEFKPDSRRESRTRRVPSPPLGNFGIVCHRRREF